MRTQTMFTHNKQKGNPIMAQQYTQTEIENTLHQMKAKRTHIIDNNLNVDIRFIEEDIQSFENALTEIRGF